MGVYGAFQTKFCRTTKRFVYGAICVCFTWGIGFLFFFALALPRVSIFIWTGCSVRGIHTDAWLRVAVGAFSASALRAFASKLVPSIFCPEFASLFPAIVANALAVGPIVELACGSHATDWTNARVGDSGLAVATTRIRARDEHEKERKE
jgi:hypothetical protein